MWKNEEIESLFNEIKTCKNQKKTLKIAFENYAKISGKKFDEIRNFYYFYAKKSKKSQKNSDFCNFFDKKLKINNFLTFSKDQEKWLFDKINKDRKNGLSARSACLRLAGGNVKLFTRFQNKYQNMLRKNKQKNQTQSEKISEFKNSFESENLSEKQNAVTANIASNIVSQGENVSQNCASKYNLAGDYDDRKIIKFQNANRLTDADINGLFMGLVKLIKKHVIDEKLEQVELDKNIVEKKFNQICLELDAKNKMLNNLKSRFEELKNENKTLKSKNKNLDLSKSVSKDFGNFENENG